MRIDLATHYVERGFFDHIPRYNRAIAAAAVAARTLEFTLSHMPFLWS